MVAACAIMAGLIITIIPISNLYTGQDHTYYPTRLKIVEQYIQHSYKFYDCIEMSPMVHMSCDQLLNDPIISKQGQCSAILYDLTYVCNYKYNQTSNYNITLGYCETAKYLPNYAKWVHEKITMNVNFTCSGDMENIYKCYNNEINSQLNHTMYCSYHDSKIRNEIPSMERGTIIFSLIIGIGLLVGGLLPVK